MTNICKKLFKFFLVGALIFLASYYAMGKSDAALINAGLLFLAAAFASRIIELNLIKRKKNS